MNATPEERTGRDDDGPGSKAASVSRLDPGDPCAVGIEEQICDHALHELEGRELLEQRAHGAAVERPIALRAWRPDCRALGAIQHTELDRRAIGGAAHQTAKGIDLADDGTLRDAADGGITGHLPDCFEVGGKQKGAGLKPRGHRRSFGAGVAATDHNNVIVHHGPNNTEQDQQTSRRRGRRREAERLRGYEARGIGSFPAAPLTFRSRP